VAFWATRAVMPTVTTPASIPRSGDIPIKITFTPPNNRSDRANYPNRVKAYLDGVASALGVNDKRFLPSYEFCEAKAPGSVTITLEAA
jgi:crossover junction endodeoxyribonuclease RusA